MNNILERDSPRPFGRFTRKGRFMYNTSLIPLYNVPSLEGYEVYIFSFYFCIVEALREL